MKTSINGLALIMAFEGCHKAVPGRPGYFKAYVDPVGVLTIGWGHTNHHEPKFTSSTIWSQEQCDAALAKDLEVFERHVEQRAKVELKQHEFDALVSWSYNTGGPISASVWAAVNEGKPQLVPQRLALYNKGTVGGVKKILPGLVRRRKAEGELFKGDIDRAMLTAGVKLSAKVEVDPELMLIQEDLRTLGYVSVGEADGKWGSMTSGAIESFKHDWNLPGPAEVDDSLKMALEKAKDQGWKRPIAEERREASSEELAPKLPEVKASKEAERIGFWTSIGTAITAIGSGILTTLGDAVVWLTPLKSFAGEIKPIYWIAAALLGSALIWYVSKKAGDAKKEATKAYQEGART